MAAISRQPRFLNIPEKKLIGQQVMMSLAENKTPELFGRFMPRRSEIAHTVNTDVICVQIFDKGFNPAEMQPGTIHQKWVAVEVSSFENIPLNMETLVIPAGLYAIFRYTGAPQDFPASFRYIFHEWLPASGYTTDDRPHFEVLGQLYKKNQPDSQEDIYVPVSAK